MSQNKISQTSRRGFLGIIPACAISGLVCPSAIAHSRGILSNAAGILQDEVHPFDTETPRKLTWRQFMTARQRNMIRFGQWLMEEKGPEEALGLFKKYTTQRLLDVGKRMGDDTANRSFKEYTDMFRDTKRWANNLVMEIVEDSENAFELKVSECLSASVFLQDKAGDLGFAMVCFGDYAHAEGFNPKIKLVRDKTLMQGDSYCNHRYIWTA